MRGRERVKGRWFEEAMGEESGEDWEVKTGGWQFEVIAYTVLGRWDVNRLGQFVRG